MARTNGAAVRVEVRAERPLEQMIPAVEDALSEMQRRPESSTLSLDLASDLQAPLEIALAVPVRLTASRAPESSEFAVRIAARRRRNVYPSFRGMLRLERAGSQSCVASLQGTYTLPLGSLGTALDLTFLRGSAAASLQRFLNGVVDEASKRVPAEPMKKG